MSVVLITGGAGLVGAETVARLADAGHEVIACTHRRADIVAGRGRRLATREWTGAAAMEPGTVWTLTADVRRDDLGFTPDVVDSITGRIDTVVHCAATVDFDARPEVYDELNVSGTANVIALAHRLGARLVQVSTAYVCGTREGEIPESVAAEPEILNSGARFQNGYEQSKYRAEALVRAADGMRWTIVRPGIVTGSSTDGYLRDRSNFYTVVKLIVEGRLRRLPGRYDATLGLTPIDHVADAVAAAALAGPEADGRTVHAVGIRSLTLRQVSDVLAEYPCFEVPRFIPASAFDAAALPARERTYFDRIGRLYVPYFSRKREFAVDGVSELFGLEPPPIDEDYLRLLLDDSLDVGFLCARRRTLDEALAMS